MSTETERLRAIERTIRTAFDAGDIATVASCYHIDGVQLLPLLEPIRGCSAVQSAFKGMQQRRTLEREVEYLGLKMSTSGDYAASHGTVNISGWENPRVGGLIGYKKHLFHDIPEAKKKGSGK